MVRQGAFGGTTGKFTSEICCGMQHIFLKLTSVTLPHVCKHEQMLDVGSPSKSFPVCKTCGYCICSKLIMQCSTFFFFSKCFIFPGKAKIHLQPICNTNHCISVSSSSSGPHWFFLITPNVSTEADVCLHRGQRKTVKYISFCTL